jgi:nicotinate phosphoribosyltransferase
MTARVSGLFTDLYELTMLEAYRALGMRKDAVFSLFVRKLPPGRNFLVACGLEDLLREIEGFRFEDEDLEYLHATGKFSPRFIDRLRSFRFTGAIHAVPEGTPVFPQEPLLEVVGPIGEAQILETLVLNQVGFQTIIASKAARIVEAAAGRPVIDFGARRAHGLDAAIKGARAGYIAGVEATSMVEAGRRYGIPVAGTVAHSFVQAFPDEAKAFSAFAAVFPNTTLLVDTYDTRQGVKEVVELAHRQGSDFTVKAVRLDSGDLLELSRTARQLLDEGGLRDVRIVASSGLDEYKIAALLEAGAPIDAFGVGTEMSVAADAPALDIAYKLTEYDGQGRIKLSSGKRSLPGRKQVFRVLRDGAAERDTLGTWEETLPGRPLLETVMSEGQRLSKAPPLEDLRARTKRLLAELPPRLRELKNADPPYPVEISKRLADAERAARDRLRKAQRA